MSETVDPDELTLHPKSREIYGEPELPEHFLKDIENVGVNNPIIVTEDSHFIDGTAIISGNRRTAAADETNQSVPIGERRTYETPEQEVDDILRENDYRDKTFSQRMSEGQAIEGIVEAEADERQKAGTDLTSTLREGETGETADIVGKRVGIGSANTYRKARKVCQAAQEGDEFASDLVAKLDEEESDTSISGAYDDFRAYEETRDITVEDIPGWDIKDVLRTLLDEERITQDDLGEFAQSDEPLVTSWLITQKDINIVTDGTVEKFVSATDSEVYLLEGATVSPDRVETEHVAFEPDGELVGQNMRLYSNSSFGPMQIDVGPKANGNFELADSVRLNEVTAAKNLDIPVDVTVRNVDGEDPLSTIPYGFWKDNLERETSRNLTEEEVGRAVEEVADHNPEWADAFERIDEIHRKRRERNE